ncbi:acetyltransferase [Colletotrichum chrysophilum]|uniref:Acetyltransferase n=1 Tax=Colletotrichum chrysophilum TaxID=1836956 RepID=A0AAD9AHE9_9PEZI|nr:acetyltransferase [Colletotrichum chrysophilum]
MADLLSIPPQHHTILRTPRLCLRAVRAGDLAAVHGMRVDAAVMRYMPNVETELVAEESRSVERIRMMKPGMFSFAVVLPLPAPSMKRMKGGEGRSFGSVGITSPPQIFYIFARESWGMGYATEALRAFLEEYWERFPGGLKTEADSGAHGVEKNEGGDFLEAHVHDGNVGSENVLRKCGFEVVREGKTTAHGVEVGTQIYRLNRPQ